MHGLRLRQELTAYKLPTIMVAWGIVMTLMGIVQSYEGLLVARIFLGVTEAGLFPGRFRAEVHASDQKSDEVYFV